jgi:putative membrane protein
MRSSATPAILNAYGYNWSTRGGTPMMWWHGDWNGWAWLAMFTSMALFWGLVVYGVITLARSTRGTGSGVEAGSDPEGILRERFARGEIDEQEYQLRLDVLRRN